MASLHLYLFELPMVITLASWALFLVMEPGSRLSLGPRLPIVALVGLSALALLGSPVAALHGVALMVGARLWLLTLFYLFTVNNPPSTLRAGSAIAFSLAVQAVVAVAPVQRQSSIVLGMLGESQLNPYTHGVAVVLFHGQRWLRAYGLNGHPNPLGGLAACALLLALITLPRRLAIATVACSSVLLLTTLSRG